jgi:hypothetical protein
LTDVNFGGFPRTKLRLVEQQAGPWSGFAQQPPKLWQQSFSRKLTPLKAL